MPINNLHKDLTFAHINICSLRNIIHVFLQLNKIDILAVSETHLNSYFQDSELIINGYSIYRKDRNKFGGGVTIYIHCHFPCKVRYDLIKDNIEAIWIQMHLPHLKPFLAGCCYRAPNSNVEYLDTLCEMMYHITEENREIYLLRDSNVDWLSENCSLKSKLRSMADTCELT